MRNGNGVLLQRPSLPARNPVAGAVPGIGWGFALGLAVVAGLCLVAPVDLRISGPAYDLLLQWRGAVPLADPPAAVVYMDGESWLQLSRGGRVAHWELSWHRALVERLSQLHARAVVLELASDPGRGFLPGDGRPEAPRGSLFLALPGTTRTRPPDDPPSSAGLSSLPVGLGESALVEGGVARLHGMPREGGEPVVALVARSMLPRPPAPAPRPRWINHYGSMEGIPAVDYTRVLSNSLPASFSVSNKVVFVGPGERILDPGAPSPGAVSTPFTRGLPSPLLNATVFTNLQRRDWLRRPPWGVEVGLFLVTSIFATFGVSRFPILPGLILSMLGGGILLLVDHVMLSSTGVWFSWTIPLCVQFPGAMLGRGVALNLERMRHRRALSKRIHQGGHLGGTDDETQSPTLHFEPEAPLHAHWGRLEIPGYTVLGPIGKGAYGQVWLARHSTGALHAVKVVSCRGLQDTDRFEREFRGIERYLPISSGHPGLVPILLVGRDPDSNSFYYAMELGDDETTRGEIDPAHYSPRSVAKDLAKRHFLTLDECLDLGLHLTEALQYLHGHHLVHRDIKPSNIIFVRGIPKLTDLGLVARSREDHEPGGAPVSTLQYIGTPGYIAPEGAGTPEADLFGLGVVLYEAATGRNRMDFPAMPSRPIPSADLPRFLALMDVILKACDPDPACRYHSAAELHAALSTVPTAPAATP